MFVEECEWQFVRRRTHNTTTPGKRKGHGHPSFFYTVRASYRRASYYYYFFTLGPRGWAGLLFDGIQRLHAGFGRLRLATDKYCASQTCRSPCIRQQSSRTGYDELKLFAIVAMHTPIYASVLIFLQCFSGHHKVYAESGSHAQYVRIAHGKLIMML